MILLFLIYQSILTTDRFGIETQNELLSVLTLGYVDRFCTEKKKHYFRNKLKYDWSTLHLKKSSDKEF